MGTDLPEFGGDVVTIIPAVVVVFIKPRNRDEERGWRVFRPCDGVQLTG